MTERTDKKIEIEIEIDSRPVKVSTRVTTDIKNVKRDLGDVLGSIHYNVKNIQKLSNELLRIKPLEEEPKPSVITEDPYGRIALDLNISTEKLNESRIIGFKAGKPQVLSTSKFKNEQEGTLILLYSYEIGLKKHFVPFDELKEVFQISGFKRSLAKILNNLKRDGRIDKKRYDSSKEATLTPRGLEDIRDRFKRILKVPTK